MCLININRVKIYIAEFTNEEQSITIDMFDISTIVSHYFIGLSIGSKNIIDEFSDFERWKSYDLLDIDDINDPEFEDIKNIIKNYTGIHMPLDEVVNILLDCNEFVTPIGTHVNMDKYCREIYLKSVIYYMNNQIGKKINKYKLRVKHYDDFHHQFSEDIISTDILENNYDFSESTIIVETYLTNDEINNKFIDFLI